MIESLIMLTCDRCSNLFNQHELLRGADPASWARSVANLLRLAANEDWSLSQDQPPCLCPSCVLHDVSHT